MTEEALLRQTIYYAIDAARVDMFGPRLCLQDVFTEKVVLTWNYSIVLNIEKFLRKVFAFAIREQAEISYIKTETI